MRRERFVRIVTPCVACEVPATNYTLLAFARRLMSKAGSRFVWISKAIDLRAVARPHPASVPGPPSQNERPTIGHLSPAYHPNDRNKSCEIRGVAEVKLEQNVL
jgi:hypothetical protein